MLNALFLGLHDFFVGVVIAEQFEIFPFDAGRVLQGYDAEIGMSRLTDTL